MKEEGFDPEAARAAAEAYDAEAKATGWLAPQVAFGLVFEYLAPGQSLLDLGIGTGLAAELFRKAGLRVHGADISPEMLAACRWKGLNDLTLHDLSVTPYPFVPAQFDHVSCVGVLNYFADPSPVLAEAAWVLKPGGMFVFVVLGRAEGGDAELVIGPEYTKTDASVTIFLFGFEQVDAWLEKSGFALVRSLPFPVYLDEKHTDSIPARCYVAQRRLTPQSVDALS